MIENCVDPPILFTDNGIGINNVSWDEPGFHDNSKTPVQVEQNYLPGENMFPIGVTQVVYNAIDKYENKASCVLNITIKGITLSSINLNIFYERKCKRKKTEIKGKYLTVFGKKIFIYSL